MLKEILNYFMIAYFSLASLFPNTDFGQLGTLVEMVEHYYEHKAEIDDPRLSFTTFLKMHFITPESHDHSDQHSHDNLPFHKISTSIDLITVPTIAEVEVEDSYSSLDNFIVKSLRSFDFLEQVYRPPSLA